MIKTKKELAYYLACDTIALGKRKKRPSLFGDEIWKFQRLMRRLDYHRSCHHRLRAILCRLRYHRLSLRLGFSIPCDVAGAGLAIVHYGTLVIADGARIGENCRIHVGVNIGANSGESTAPTVGKNVYIGPGAKLIGDIVVGDGAVIGAGAVVTKDVPPAVTVGGVPAKIISEKDSSHHLTKATELYNGGRK